MDATTASLIAFAAMFGGAVFGIYTRLLLPAHHLSSSSRDVVRLCIAILATVSSLVIGLLIASAKSSFDDRTTSLRHFVAQSLLLDRAMANYGADADPVRRTFREVLEARLTEILDFDHASAQIVSNVSFDAVERALLDLPATTDRQRLMKDRALSLLSEITQTRWLLVEQGGGSIQLPFLVILVIWLAVIFASFGLFSPRNGTVLVVMAVSAASIAGSLFLILEMDQPYDGLIRLSQESVESVLTRIGQP